MKLDSICIALVFLITNLFGPYAYADKYQDQAKKYVEAYNANVEYLAKVAVVNQLDALTSNITNGLFSPQSQDQIIKKIDERSIALIDSANALLEQISLDKTGEIQLDSLESKVGVMISEISTLSSLMHRLSWGIRDQMDAMYGANDWMVQAINGFQNRCSLGYFNFLETPQLDTASQPPAFKSDLNMFFGLSFMFDSGSNSENVDASNTAYHNELSLHSSNYMNSDMEFLQEAQRAANYVASATTGVAVNLALAPAVINPATGALVSKTALGASTGTWGTAAAVSFGVGVAIAVAIFVIGSFEAYKEQKRWARAEVYKFLKSMDSDDFSAIYRSECTKFSDNLNVLKDLIVKYQTDQAFKASVDAELKSVKYGECRNILNPQVPAADESSKSESPKNSKTADAASEQTKGTEVSTPNNIVFTEDAALAVFKYYQCATQLHGPKLFSEITSEKILEISSRLNNLRGYLSEYIFIISKLNSDLSNLIVRSDLEIKIDRLYKNLVVAATGVILGLNTSADYLYQKKLLQHELNSSEEVYLINKDDIKAGIDRIEFHVKDFIL